MGLKTLFLFSKKETLFRGGFVAKVSDSAQLSGLRDFYKETPAVSLSHVSFELIPKR